jgi:hypothetical protein
MKHESDLIFYGKSNIMRLARCFLAGLFLLFHLTASAQQRNISGTVTGTDNSALPGVSVMVKGTTIGTLTDIDGKFTLPVPQNAQTLVFSFIGMQSQEVPVSETNTYNVVLKESVVGLDEVIVIGYGTAKKADLTGSVVRVQTEQFQSQNIKQVTEMLTGTVAGFSSNQGNKAAVVVISRSADQHRSALKLILLSYWTELSLMVLLPTSIRVILHRSTS